MATIHIYKDDTINKALCKIGKIEDCGELLTRYLKYYKSYAKATGYNTRDNYLYKCHFTGNRIFLFVGEMAYLYSCTKAMRHGIIAYNEYETICMEFFNKFSVHFIDKSMLLSLQFVTMLQDYDKIYKTMMNEFPLEKNERIVLKFED